MSAAPSAGNSTVPFAYLSEQFANPDAIFDDIRSLVATGDFTLGGALETFEQEFADRLGANHAIGVNCGTDAIRLSLMAAGIGPGDEVITAANTFIGTVGAIHEVGARPIFVDVDDTFCLDVDQMATAINSKTKALLPVHLTGNMANMPRIISVAEEAGLPVIEDACQAICSTWNGKAAGTFGLTGTFSLHPLKFLNIWGDGGVITTNDNEVATRLRLIRNHGLKDRDTVVLMGVNSRLDTLQAIVARHILRQADEIISRRNAVADTYDRGLSGLPGVKVPQRTPEVGHTFVTYQILADKRDDLMAYCRDRGVDAKIHYPMPVYCQPGLAQFGYKLGDFPNSDRQAQTTLTLPVHQYVKLEQTAHIIETVRGFFGK